MTVTLTITLDEGGKVGINGPLQDKILCYGLLECAKVVIAQYAAKDAPLIQPASGILPPFPGTES